MKHGVVRQRPVEERPSVDCSLIVANRDRFDLLTACVESFVEASRLREHDYEIIVADASVESDKAFLWARSNGHRAVRVPDASYAQANNAGAKVAHGTVLVLANNDLLFTTDVLAALTAPKIAGDIVGARLLYPPTEHGVSLVQHAGIGFDQAGNPYNLWRNAPAEHPRVMVPSAPAAVTFALVAITRSLWRTLGGLDEFYINSYEDADFCLRAREIGARISYEPLASAIHFEGQSPGRNARVRESFSHFHKEWISDGRIYRTLGIYPFTLQG